MQTVKSGSIVRMALAFAAVLFVAGSGVVLAGGPNPAYPPKSSVLLGPTTVAHNATANYVLRVTNVRGQVFDFPDANVFGLGAVFTAANGTVTSNTGFYTAPAAGTKDRVTGFFAINGVTVASSLVINLTP